MLLMQKDSVLHGAIVRCRARSYTTNHMACTSLITAIAAVTTTIPSANATDAATRRSYSPSEDVFTATGRYARGRAARRLCTIHHQAHFAQSRNMVAQISLL